MRMGPYYANARQAGTCGVLLFLITDFRSECSAATADYAQTIYYIYIYGLQACLRLAAKISRVFSADDIDLLAIVQSVLLSCRC